MENSDIPVAMTIGTDGYVRTGVLVIDRRLRNDIDAEVEALFAVEVREWAGRDSGRLRTRLGLRVEVSQRYLVLLEALGPWAVVDSAEIFPRREVAAEEWEFRWDD